MAVRATTRAFGTVDPNTGTTGSTVWSRTAKADAVEPEAVSATAATAATAAAFAV